MSNINNRKCVCCGSEYAYCNKCGRDSAKPSWMISFCSEKCLDTFTTAIKVSDGELSKAEAKEFLSKYTYKDLDKEILNSPSIRNIVKSIVALENEEPSVDVNIENASVEEVVEKNDEDVKEVKHVVNENKNQNNKFNNKSFYKNNK